MKLLVRDRFAAALALTSGHEQPDYDGYFATLNADQRQLLADLEQGSFEMALDLRDMTGMLLHRHVLHATRWVLAHPRHQPAWFDEFARRSAGFDFMRYELDPWLALRGHADSASRLCAGLTKDLVDEESLAVLALTGTQCANVVELARDPGERFGLWTDDGKPCSLEASQASAWAKLRPVLPDTLRVDAGVEVSEGCGAFIAAFAAQRTVGPLVRRRFERLGYRVEASGEPCRDPLGAVFDLPPTTTHHVAVDPDQSLTCRFAIDDARRRIEVTGSGPPARRESDE